jgi:hypothetical protein
MVIVEVGIAWKIVLLETLVYSCGDNAGSAAGAYLYLHSTHASNLKALHSNHIFLNNERMKNIWMCLFCISFSYTYNQKMIRVFAVRSAASEQGL